MAGGTSEAELNEGTIEVGKIDEHRAFALEILRMTVRLRVVSSATITRAPLRPTFS